MPRTDSEPSLPSPDSESRQSHKTQKSMDPSIISATRALLPSNAIYADWAASALPLPVSTPPTFIPPAHTTDHPDIDKARRALQHFLQDTKYSYHVIFTSGATEALRILADRLPWSHRDALFCHAHVHNAVLGIRNPALSAGAQFRSLRSDELDRELTVNRKSEELDLALKSDQCHNTPFAVLAYPGQCNLTGTSYPLSWARKAKERGLFSYSPERMITLLDTAKLAASTSFCLDSHSAYVDAVVFSLYKLSASFTGLGALLVRKDSLLEKLLRSTAERSYFAGGRTVEAVSPFSSRLFAPARKLASQLEAGTPNLQAIHHLHRQLEVFSPSQRVMADIQHHSSLIAASFSGQLVDAFSPKGVRIYRDVSLRNSQCGSSVVAFSLYRTEEASGWQAPIGHSEIGMILKINSVFARSGCMCNTGACCAVLGLSDADVATNYAKGHRCGDDMDLINGKPTGVVRISFGWASLAKDADSIVHILRNYVSVSVRRHITGVPAEIPEQNRLVEVDSLYVYPVKSCAGTEVSRFDLDKRGGAFGDRVFAVEDVASSELLNLRSCPALANICASYSDDGTMLILELKSSIARSDLTTQKGIEVEIGQIDSQQDCLPEDCGDNCRTYHSLLAPKSTHGRCTIGGEVVTGWLSSIVGKPARLVRQMPGDGQCQTKHDVLIVSRDELEVLKNESGIGSLKALRAALRPNIVLASLSDGKPGSTRTPFSLHDFKSFRKDTTTLYVKQSCTRCAVVNIAARENGFDVQGEPLRTIARMSRRIGQRGLVFGVLATLVSDCWTSSEKGLRACTVPSRVEVNQKLAAELKNSHRGSDDKLTRSGQESRRHRSMDKDSYRAIATT